MTAFFDTNILVYTVSTDWRKHQAEKVLRQGGVISAQVLNEFTNAARNKLKHSWTDVERAIAHFLRVFDSVVPLTTGTHAAAVELARDHNLSFYDALIVAAAISADCRTLYSEDLQHGRKFEGLTIVNPFEAPNA